MCACACVLYDVLQVHARSLETVRRLHATLLGDYDRTVRPTRNQDKALVVELGLSLISVAYLDKDSGSVAINTWLHMVSALILSSVES